MADFFINDTTKFIKHYKKVKSIYKEKKAENKRRKKEDLEPIPLINSLIESFMGMMKEDDAKELRKYLDELNLLRHPL